MQLKWLKFVYNGILTGMPPLTYNAISKTTLHVPFTIKPKSVYINYALNESQKDYIQDYIHKYDPDMALVPVKMFETEVDSKYYLSVNVYNCTSPIFFGNEDKEITRFEINTYIKKHNKMGTLLLDYTSNFLSMDPIHIFKPKETVVYDFPPMKTQSASIFTHSNKDCIHMSINYLPMNYQLRNKQAKLHNDLIRYSDRIYYKNGIFDKLYYDSSLTYAPIVLSMYNNQNYFQYKDLCFERAMNIFYFEDSIQFIGGMWDNVFSLSE